MKSTSIYAKGGRVSAVDQVSNYIVLDSHLSAIGLVV
jgi:hypothetical protein